MQWDHTVDFLVVGSGAGGMTGALTAAASGADCMLLEKTEQFGGTTALSGGVVWMPVNDSMQAAGIADSEQDALDYLEQLVDGQVSKTRLLAYIRGSREMLDFVSKHSSLRFDACTRYADYYPELKGGKSGGRSMEPVPVSRRVIGKHAEQQRFPDFLKDGFMRFAITVKESREVMDMSLLGKWYMARNILRYYMDIPARLKRQPDSRQTLGRALVVHLRRALLDHKVPLWLNSAVDSLIIEKDRVVGATVLKDGRSLRVQARKGVLLATGGMGANVDLRQHYGQLPTGESFSSEAPGNVGDAIALANQSGAALQFMHCAWWTPSVILPDGQIQALISGKSMPGSIFIDAAGSRFCNEAAPYEDVIKALWKHQSRGQDCVPSYMIFDARARQQYMMGPVPPGSVQPDQRLPTRFFSSGFLKRAETLKDLARLTGADPDTLEQTVERHNRFAESGKDEDFGRGDSENDRYYSDPSISPNPNLAPIVRAPFYAIAVYPGDLGTKGGLQCNEHAQVLRTNGSTIEGLYATGNCAAAVMGDSYPGAGSTIGPAMTFAYLAAKHALNSDSGRSDS